MSTVSICTIELSVLDTSALQVAHAIIKYYGCNNDNREKALIDLQELSEHIDSYIRAERKALEVNEHE